MKCSVKAFVILLFWLSSLFQPVCAAAQPGGNPAGGAEVIFDLDPDSPSVCFAVSVGAGSAVETPGIRGITHFIEHMAFDGSERFTRSEMSEWVDNNGVFLNAFTRAEHTVFFILARKELADEALELLSEMLLHSIFPHEEVEKERNIILEEIREAEDNPRHARGRLVQRYLYMGSGMASPVLGYPETVGNISREQLIRYYREYYTPSNMEIFVMGGISREKASSLVKGYFPPDNPAPKLIDQPRISWSNAVAARYDPDYEPGFDLLVRVKGGGGRIRRLAGAKVLSILLSEPGSYLEEIFENRGITVPGVSLEIHNRFCALRFSIKPDRAGAIDTQAVYEVLQSLSVWKPAKEKVETAVRSYLSSDLFDREKYHYYLMLHGEEMAVLGKSYFEDYLPELEQVSSRAIRSILSESFSRIDYNGLLLTESRRVNLETVTVPDTELLENGVRIAALRREGSSLAALNILIEEPNCIMEPEDAGFGALIHKIFETAAREERLYDRLDRMGARVGWGDNPYIPMDDYLMNRSFSFIRLEAPLSSFEESAGLLIEHLRSANLTPDRIQVALGKIARERAIRENSPLFRLRGSLYSELFNEHPYGYPFLPEGGAAFSSNEAESFRREYFNGGRLAATMVSALGRPDSRRILRKLFGRFGSREPSSGCSPFPGEHAAGRRVVSGRTEGAYLLAAIIKKYESGAGAAAAAVAAEILDRRIKNEIRENRGLAYSTGCRFSLMKGGFAVEAYLGTRMENQREAEEALSEEIGRLNSERPGADEVAIAINRLSSARSRRELSSINEAYSAGIDILLFPGDRFMNLVADTGADDVQEAIESCFGLEKFLLYVMVPGEGVSEKRDTGMIK